MNVDRSAISNPLIGTPLACESFTYDEAVRGGLTRRTLQRLVAEGHLRVPLRNVYVPAGLPDSLEVRGRCLAKVAAPHVVVVDRSAAWLWGVSAYTLSEESGRVPLDAFSLRGRTRVRRGDVRSGTRDLAARDVVQVQGVRVTTPVRTALDLACSLSRFEAVAAVDALMRAQGLNQDELLSELPRLRGRRGVVQARDVLTRVDGRAESSGESFTRIIMVDEGLPVPDLQVWVYDEHGDPVYRLDHAYEPLKIGIEYDGEDHHTSEADRRHDAERRAWLRSQGWRIIVVTRHDMAVHRRAAWIEAVRQARAERLEELRLLRVRPRQRADRLTRDQVSRARR